MGKINRRKTPIVVDQSACYIGKPPSAPYFGEPIMSSFQYLNNWSQNGQLFTYSGPPDDQMNDAPGQDGTFYIILQGADKADDSASNDHRQLGGALLPWKYDAEQLTSQWTSEVSISWEHDGAAADLHYEQSVANSGQSSNYFNDLTSWNDPIKLYGNDFVYTPAADYSMGKLVTTGIQTAALGVLTMPDPVMSPAQSVFFADNGNHAYIAPDRAIRGYTGTGDPSLGTMIHLVGDTSRNDDLVWNTQRCLFQWGHPRGVWSDTDSYTELATDARYKLIPQNYREQSTSTQVTLHPLIVATSTGADAGNQAFVKLTIYDDVPAVVDTWEISFYDNATTLYKYSSGSGSDGINIDCAPCTMKVEIQSPTSGEVLLHTIALWQAPEW